MTIINATSAIAPYSPTTQAAIIATLTITPAVKRAHELHSTNDDKTLVESRIMVCKIVDSKVAETRIYPGDQYALDEFWE